MPTCDAVRESLSAHADGESAVLDRLTCATHVAGCVPCATFDRSLVAVLRTTRLREAEVVPDLTASILVAASEQDTKGEVDRRKQARVVLGLIGVAQAIIALIALTGDAGHLSRELATWELALGVGFGWAAWQPHRAVGLVPMVAVLSFVSIVGAVGDLLGGATTMLAEMEHLVEVAGVVLVVAVSRDEGGVRGSLRHLRH